MGYTQDLRRNPQYYKTNKQKQQLPLGKLGVLTSMYNQDFGPVLVTQAHNSK